MHAYVGSKYTISFSSGEVVDIFWDAAESHPKLEIRVGVFTRPVKDGADFVASLIVQKGLVNLLDSARPMKKINTT
jgi:hypothetical protein